MGLADGVAITWLGHATVLLESPGGTRILIDPWLEGNPKLPEALPDLSRLDAVLVTHGHFDHMASVVPVAQATGAPVVCIPEISAYLAHRGVTSRWEMNKGGTRAVGDLRVTMVLAEHSGGIDVEGGPSLEGGDPVGFIIRHEASATTVYAAGDTTVFGDMRLIRELYRPQVGIVPIDGNFNMGPREAALAVELLGLRRVMPIHYGTFPLLAGRPEELGRELAARGWSCEVLAAAPGQRYVVPERGGE